MAKPTRKSILSTSNSDPYSFYEQLRADGPVNWDEGMKGWLFTGYEQCAYVGKNEDLFAEPWPRLEGGAEVWGKRGLFMLTGSIHRALHKRLTDFVKRKSHDKAFHAEFIQPEVDRLIASFASEGRIDLAKRFADPLPLRVIGVVLGLPRDDALLDRWKIWIDDIGRWAEMLHFGKIGEADLEKEWVDSIAGWKGTWRQVRDGGYAANDALTEVLLPIIRDRRDAPHDDLISDLWTSGRAELPDWNEDDVLGQTRLLCVAGSRTTATLVCNAAYTLLSHPELRARVLANGGRKVPQLVEETLRMLPSLHVRMRIATEDVEVAGQLIKAGDHVHPLSAAANRDPGHYEHPQDIDLDRKAFMDHQAFNVGPRHCVGAELARAEAVAAIRTLFQRLPGLQLDLAAEKPEFVGFNNRSFRPLNVTLLSSGG